MKKPEIKRPEPTKRSVEMPDFARNNFDIDASLKKELDEKGLIPRWVNIKQMENYGGYHPKGWVPYKRESISDTEKLFGNSTDGYLRRGDTVLAVKKKEDVDKHRAYLRNEAKSSSVKELTKRTKKDFKDMIKSAGMQDSIKVNEGYDD
jgi:hypothetical protein